MASFALTISYVEMKPRKGTTQPTGTQMRTDRLRQQVYVHTDDRTNAGWSFKGVWERTNVGKFCPLNLRSCYLLLLALSHFTHM